MKTLALVAWWKLWHWGGVCQSGGCYNYNAISAVEVMTLMQLLGRCPQWYAVMGVQRMAHLLQNASRQRWRYGSVILSSSSKRNPVRLREIDGVSTILTPPQLRNWNDISTQVQNIWMTHLFFGMQIRSPAPLHVWQERREHF